VHDQQDEIVGYKIIFIVDRYGHLSEKTQNSYKTLMIRFYMISG